MRILALETSTKTFSLAVSENSKILAYRNIKLTRVLSSSIIPAINAILKKTNLELENLDGFAIGLGPGSFTSLRVGLSTVKALSLAANKPVVGISSLDILAMNTPEKIEGPVCVVSDAKRSLLYACFYTKKGNSFHRQSDYLLIGIEELLSKTPRDAFFIGDGVGLYKKELLKKIGNSPEKNLAEEKLWSPQANRLVALAYPRFLKKDFQSAENLTPIYLYAEDCQIQK